MVTCHSISKSSQQYFMCSPRSTLFRNIQYYFGIKYQKYFRLTDLLDLMDCWMLHDTTQFEYIYSILYIGYPTGIETEITLFGFQNEKMRNMPLGVKTCGIIAACPSQTS